MKYQHLNYQIQWLFKRRENNKPNFSSFTIFLIKRIQWLFKRRENNKWQPPTLSSSTSTQIQWLFKRRENNKTSNSHFFNSQTLQRFNDSLKEEKTTSLRFFSVVLFVLLGIQWLFKRRENNKFDRKKLRATPTQKRFNDSLKEEKTTSCCSNLSFSWCSGDDSMTL